MSRDETLSSENEPTPARRRRYRRVTLQRALRQADKAGVTVSGATLNPDGSIMLQFDQAHGPNEWDNVK
jgi:hypothetical protein